MTTMQQRRLHLLQPPLGSSRPLVPMPSRLGRMILLQAMQKRMLWWRTTMLPLSPQLRMESLQSRLTLQHTQSRPLRQPHQRQLVMPQLLTQLRHWR